MDMASQDHDLTASGERKITVDELREMFGGEIPMEAANLIWTEDGDRTIGEVRTKLVEMARRYQGGNGEDIFDVIERLTLFADDWAHPGDHDRRLTGDGRRELAADIRAVLALLERKVQPAIPA